MKMKDIGQVKVSVCCITYNHAAYLAQTIESVMAQEFAGHVELVIGEDCSTDGTRALALAYQAQYPGRVRVLTPARNLGVMVNLMATLAACDGDYIAVLDGDDYWTDPTKLQRQVDALRANPDCSFCFHDALAEAIDSTETWTFSERFTDILPPSEEELLRRYTQLDLALKGWFIPTASMLFRAASLPRPLPAWFAGVFSGDYTLQLLSAKSGPVLYLPRLMSHYRLHSQSIMRTSAQSISQYQRRVYELGQYKSQKLIPAAGYEAINERLAYYIFELSLAYREQGNQGLRWYYYSKAITVSSSDFMGHVKRLMKKAVSLGPGG